MKMTLAWLLGAHSRDSLRWVSSFHIIAKLRLRYVGLNFVEGSEANALPVFRSEWNRYIVYDT